MLHTPHSSSGPTTDRQRRASEGNKEQNLPRLGTKPMMEVKVPSDGENVHCRHVR